MLTRQDARQSTLEMNNVTVEIIRSHRRTFNISVNLDGHVSCRVPANASQDRVARILQEKADWIARAQSRMKARPRPQTVDYMDGSRLYVLGEPYVLNVVAADTKWPQLLEQTGGWSLTLPFSVENPQNEARQCVVRWLRRKAEDHISGRVRDLAAAMDLPVPQLGFKGQKRIWGSCSKARCSLSINWKIIAFPSSVIDYVIIHELCHLVHADHSRRFWRLVAENCLTWRESRRWLKNEASKYCLI